MGGSLSQTVDFGIDLGTTNSAVARMQKKGPALIRSRSQSPVFPSAVTRNRAGQVLVGDDALRDPDLAATRAFKRLMGTTNSVPLWDGSQWKPEQLSAEVLKDLKAAVKRRYDEDLVHVVITVPAMFQQPQCEATHRAAELAGLEALALLQEPIAAATAYLSEDPEDGHYLVYDLGGGTFDISVVELRDSEMTVVSHGGNNYLGGVDIDNRLHEWVLERLEAHGIGRSAVADPRSRHILLRECERVKILLTDEEAALMDLGDLEVPVPPIRVDRRVVEYAADQVVSETLRLTQRRLEEAGLDSWDVKSVLLVGGPTQMPFLRRRLRDDLGLTLRVEQDPLTVVASGAAIHASTLLRPGRGSRRSAPGVCSLELHYDPVVQSSPVPMSGRVTSPAGFRGEARVSRVSGDWATGWIPLQNSAFAVDVALEAQDLTEFQVEVRDERGTPQAVEPERFTLRRGVAAAAPVAPYNYGVALVDFETQPILRKGETLPAYRKLTFRTAHDVRGGTDEAVQVYFLEGESPHSSDNSKVGHLPLTGRALGRTLPAGTEVEVSLRMDESRLLKVKVYVPLLDLEFEPPITTEIGKPRAQDLAKSVQEIRKQLADLQEHAEADEQQVLMESARDLEHLEAEIQDAPRGETDREERVQKKLADVRAHLRPALRRHELDILYAEVQEQGEGASSLCRAFGDVLGANTVERLVQEARTHYEMGSRERLESIKNRIRSIFWEHYLKTRECWVRLHQHLRTRVDGATDRVRFHDLLKKADGYLAQEDLDGARLCLVQAMELLDEGSGAELGLYGDAGLRR